MLALISVWIGLLSFLIAALMLICRPAFTDLTVPLVLWFGTPGSLCLALMVLWAYRKEPGGDREDPGVGAQRTQAKVAIALAILAAAIVYALIIGAEKIEPGVASVSARPKIEDGASDFYNPQPREGAIEQ